MGGQHLKRVLGLIGFGIPVGNTDIQNTVSATGPKTMDKKITTILTRNEQRGGEGAEEAGGAGGTTGQPGQV